MRVLFGVSNWAGHWFPTVPLAWALRAAGHDVRVACPPEQADAVSAAGLLAMPFLEGPDMVLGARLHNYGNALAGRWRFPEPPPHPITGERVASLDEFDLAAWRAENRDRIAGAARRSTDAAVAFARRWRPGLVVHDLMSLEGPLLGRVLGVPALLHLWGLFGPDDLVAGLFPLVPADDSEAFPRHGVGTMGPDVYRYVVDPSPPSAAPPLRAERLGLRYLPYNGPGAMPSWLAATPDPAPDPVRRRRVCVVWGTAVSTMFGPATFAVPKVLAGLAELDVDVVVTVISADRRRIGPVGPRVRLLEHTPLHLLLPDCDLVVHHGGAGCAMTAAAAGTPQLILPNGLDQDTVAARMADAGVARVVHNAIADAGDVAAAAADLLDNPDYRAAAARLRDEVAALPTPAALASTAEHMVAGTSLVSD
ncbi:nucleotide disphospho-sugar-binding domain-containing protein [Plantactinospora sp. B6F1]|uniref:nucleotide disphospho-sugar-binding domain-containing protein n=1 Tax=Plantactinospora sp. B6F1 TaxID=3158971 RepID=UPI00102C6E00